MEEQEIKVACGIVFYDDKKCLEHCLKTVDPFVDVIIGIDGRYKGYDAKSELSTDGSREVFQQYKKAKVYDFPDLSEPAKRQKYCDLTKEEDCNFLLILDSDEYIIRHYSDYRKFRVSLVDQAIIKRKGVRNVFKVKMREPLNKYPPGYGDMFVYPPRVWYNPWEIEYTNDVHWSFRNRSRHKFDHVIDLESQRTLHEMDLIDGIVLGHEADGCRSVRRQTSRTEFETIQHAYERKQMIAAKTAEKS